MNFQEIIKVIYLTLIGVGFGIFFTACDTINLKEIDFPEVLTGVFQPDEGLNSGTIEGTINGLLPGSFVQEYGHIWSTTTPLNYDLKEGQITPNQ